MIVEGITVTLHTLELQVWPLFMKVKGKCLHRMISYLVSLTSQLDYHQSSSYFTNNNSFIMLENLLSSPIPS